MRKASGASEVLRYLTPQVHIKTVLTVGTSFSLIARLNLPYDFRPIRWGEKKVQLPTSGGWDDLEQTWRLDGAPSLLAPYFHPFDPFGPQVPPKRKVLGCCGIILVLRTRLPHKQENPGPEKMMNSYQRMERKETRRRHATAGMTQTRMAVNPVGALEQYKARKEQPCSV